MSNLLCDVPEEVLRASILPFCNVKDIIRLDSAVNNHAMKRDLDPTLRHLVFKSVGPYSVNYKAWHYFSKKVWFVDEFCVPPYQECTGRICDFYGEHGSSSIRSLSFADCKIIDWDQLIDWFLVYLYKIRRLDLSRSIDTTFNLVENLPNHILSNLTWLCLEDFIWVGDNGWEAITDNCLQLEHLNISGCNLSIDEEDAEALQTLTQLTYLGVGGCLSGDDALMEVVHSCPQLTGLDLSNCIGITDTGVETLAETLTQLKNLKLAHCVLLTDQSVLALAKHCKLLEELNLENCQLLTDHSVSAIALNCDNLRSINVSKVDSLTNLFMLSVLDECARLQVLDVSGNGNINDEHVIRLTKAYCGKYLTSLNFAWCTNIGDAAVLAVAEQCAQLQHLNLDSSIQAVEGPAGLEVGGRTLVTATSVLALAERCTQLTFLNVANVIGIDDNTVATIASHCTKLESLNVYGCNRITDASILSISQHLRQLRTLDVACCRKLTTVLPLALNRHLESLNLRGCWDVVDIDTLVAQLPRLNKLYVQECKFVTDQLLRVGHKLHTLCIARCLQVTDEGVLDLVQSSYALRLLSISGCTQISGECLALLDQTYESFSLEIDLRQVKLIDGAITAAQMSNPHFNGGLSDDSDIEFEEDDTD